LKTQHELGCIINRLSNTFIYDYELCISLFSPQKKKGTKLFHTILEQVLEIPLRDAHI